MNFSFQLLKHTVDYLTFHLKMKFSDFFIKMHHLFTFYIIIITDTAFEISTNRKSIIKIGKSYLRCFHLYF